MKKYSSELDKLVQIELIDYVSKNNKIRRKDLFPIALKMFDLSESDYANKSPESSFGIANSLSGIIINNLIKLNTLIFDGDYLVLNKPNETLTKKEIVEYFHSLYLTDDEKKEKDPESKKNVISSFIGCKIKEDSEFLIGSRESIIEKMKSEIDKSNRITELLLKDVNDSVIPFTPLGNLYREHNKMYRLYKSNSINCEQYENSTISIIGQLFGMADELFENFIFSLIKKVYGKQIIKEEFLAGPADEGIDCKFEIEDPCGFPETVIVQAKIKKAETKNLGVKVLREYVGVMTLKGADKCIIVSNVDFTKEARDNAKNLNSVLLIGLKELYKLMCTTGYGIKTEEHNIKKIDETVFLI